MAYQVLTKSHFQRLIVDDLSRLAAFWESMLATILQAASTTSLPNNMVVSALYIRFDARGIPRPNNESINLLRQEAAMFQTASETVDASSVIGQQQFTLLYYAWWSKADIFAIRIEHGFEMAFKTFGRSVVVQIAWLTANTYYMGSLTASNDSDTWFGEDDPQGLHLSRRSRLLGPPQIPSL